ncbi:hypothetical protein [uncultured Rikenella sp.]|uniref:hypothetical protein n=1 Tax=uncultured Rikenella sp. TaxID=368003 RepID=UPI0025DB15AF|nr:hypothetical protein [uncultured Rikenella sp.]
MKRFQIKDYRVTLTDELLPHDFESGSFRPYYDCVLELREEGLVAIQDEHPEFQKADWASCAGSMFYGCDDIQSFMDVMTYRLAKRKKTKRERRKSKSFERSN